MHTYYKKIGSSLFVELLKSLDKGRHIALLGPRNSGKSLVQAELKRLISERSSENQPTIILLSWKDFANINHNEYIQVIAEKLSLKAAWKKATGMTLSGQLKELFYQAAVEHLDKGIWIFIQDILGFPIDMARELLLALQDCYHDDRVKGHISAIITGSADFIPLTYSQLSPFRHAQKYILTGLERNYARTFFCRRRIGLRGQVSFIGGMPEGEITADQCADLITPEAFDYLYEQTGGMSSLIQQVINTCIHNDHIFDPKEVSGTWSKQRTKQYINQFVDDYMRNDNFARMSLREVERDRNSFDILLKIINGEKVDIPRFTPYSLEVGGLIRRDENNGISIFCPIWKRFLAKSFDNLRIADAYALQHRWKMAWEQYKIIPPDQLIRPVSGDALFRLRSILSDWEDSMVDLASGGTEAVCQQFFLGVKYLLRFESGGLYDEGTGEDKTMYQPEFLPVGDVYKPHPRKKPDYEDNDNITFWLDAPRFRLYCKSNISLRYLPNIKPCLFLGRQIDTGREIGVEEQGYLWHAISRFWHAYVRAWDIEYGKEITGLWDKYNLVIERVNQLLTREPFDMGTIIQGAAEYIVTDVGYYRIQICLVNAGKGRIQAVACYCQDKNKNIDYGTDFPLDDHNKPIERWDIQSWVVHKKQTCIIADASSKGNINPITQWEKSKILGMKTITVVPMKVKDEEVVGTIHFEKENKGKPSELELKLLEVLAGQLAVIFHLAIKLTLLRQSLMALTAQIRIISPDRNNLFLNKAAADKHNEKAAEDDVDRVEAGWQKTPVLCDCIKVTKNECLFIKEILESGKDSHHYIIEDGPDKVEASDWLVSPLDDFRKSLAAPFKGADSRIGYVERIHDLTDFYLLYKSLQGWLEVSGVRSTAEKILEYFEAMGFQWCRIYLIEQDDLVSLEEFGLKNEETKKDFREGKIKFNKYDKDPQLWHVIKSAGQILIYEYKEDDDKDKIKTAPDFKGLPRFYTSAVQKRILLEKQDINIWVEAPLFVGNKPIGKLSLSMLPDLLPDKWELLRNAVLGTAVALHDALRTEMETRRIEDNWRLAASQVRHQLSNKLSPVGSWLYYAKKDIVKDPEKAKNFIDRAKQSIDEALEIIGDFKRYATDEPFEDQQIINISELLKQIQEMIAEKYSQLKNIKVTESSSSVTIMVSIKAILEIFEILVLNSIEHSDQSLNDLAVEISTRIHNDKEVVIEYVDNGVGIPEYIKERVFQPFFTTSPQGTGLGLSIAQRIARRLGGRITLENRFCFELYLPILCGKEL